MLLRAIPLLGRKFSKSNDDGILLQNGRVFVRRHSARVFKMSCKCQFAIAYRACIVLGLALRCEQKLEWHIASCQHSSNVPQLSSNPVLETRRIFLGFVYSQPIFVTVMTDLDTRVSNTKETITCSSSPKWAPS